MHLGNLCPLHNKILERKEAVFVVFRQPLFRMLTLALGYV